MIKIENYANAYKEVYVILNHMKAEDVAAIPQLFINMIKNNMNKAYKFELNEKFDFNDKKLLRETKVILAYIFLNYWSTKEEKRRIEQKFRQDIINHENKIKYQFNQIKKEKPQHEFQKENVQMIEHKEENIYRKIINKMKKIFNRK